MERPRPSGTHIPSGIDIQVGAVVPSFPQPLPVYLLPAATGRRRAEECSLLGTRPRR